MNTSCILQWLTTCELERSQCLQTARPTRPTRLIDVGSSDGSQDPRLVIMDPNHTLGTQYVALSHCWGTPRDSQSCVYPCTIKNNIGQFINGLKTDTLPRTFQDAIEVVRALKMRHLWIDALCIVQDDREDWAREAVRMKQVYGDAFLTIVATSAASDHDGFLHRPPITPPAISLPFQPNESSIGSNGQYHMAYRSSGGDEGSWLRVLDSSPWNTRGWTFQEHLLSRRALHFTSSKIFWECRTTDGSEENEPTRKVSYKALWMSTNPTESLESQPDRMVVKLNNDFDPRFDEWYHLVSQ